MLGDAAAEGRHALRPALDDGPEDDARAAAVNPLVIHQRRTDGSTAIGVTSRAIELVEQLFASANDILGRLNRVDCRR
jgi:hypothetical protein